jgi:Flp pilus assembly protein TadG
MRIRRKSNSDRGASLVEFAIVLPLLVLLLFGIIEFGWAFAQNLEVKHIAREVGRLATVDDPDNQILSRTCGATIADVQSATPSGGTDPGDTVTVTVTADLQQITGFFGWALGSIGNLQSVVEIRLEQELNWAGTTCP